MAASHERKALHAYVSDGAHTTWHHHAAMNGISLSVMLEKLAPVVGDMLTPKMVQEARDIDTERRRRGGRSRSRES